MGTSSDRANLGTEILTFLETGERIPLTLIISVLKEALHRVPKTSGWILENFPTNLEQYEMFESEIVDLQDYLEWIACLYHWRKLKSWRQICQSNKKLSTML